MSRERILEPITIRQAVNTDGQVVHDIAVKSRLAGKGGDWIPESFSRQFTNEALENDYRNGMRSFVAFVGEKPAGFLTIDVVSYSFDQAKVTIGEMATLPEYRGFRLLGRMFGYLANQQQEHYTYSYYADALLDTSYKGLSRPGVQEWLRRKGYEVSFGKHKQYRSLPWKNHKTVEVVIAQLRNTT